jgi:hypothetical protein
MLYNVDRAMLTEGEKKAEEKQARRICATFALYSLFHPGFVV